MLALSLLCLSLQALAAPPGIAAFLYFSTARGMFALRPVTCLLDDGSGKPPQPTAPSTAGAACAAVFGTSLDPAALLSLGFAMIGLLSWCLCSPLGAKPLSFALSPSPSNVGERSPSSFVVPDFCLRGGAALCDWDRSRLDSLFCTLRAYMRSFAASFDLRTGLKSSELLTSLPVSPDRLGLTGATCCCSPWPGHRRWMTGCVRWMWTGRAVASMASLAFAGDGRACRSPTDSPSACAVPARTGSGENDSAIRFNPAQQRQDGIGPTRPLCAPLRKRKRMGPRRDQGGGSRQARGPIGRPLQGSTG